MLTPAFGLSLVIGAVGAIALAAVANALQLPPWAIYPAFVAVVAASMAPLARAHQSTHRARRR